MGNKLTAKLAGICVGGLLLAMPMSASADTYHSLLNQSQTVAKQKQIAKNDLAKVNAQMDDLTGKISKSQIAIGKTQDEIATLNKNIQDTKKRIEDRQDLLKERMIASYKNGGSSVNVMELLLGSKSFGDFINRAVAIYNITDHDNDVIQKQVADQKLLETQQTKVKKDLADSKAKLQELKQLVAKVEVVQAQKQATLDGLNSKASQINGDLSKIKSERAALAAASAPKSSSSSSSSSNAIVQMSYIPSSAASGGVGDIISASRQFMNGRSDYVFGAMDPAHGNFDCSGYVNWAYRQIGINLGARSTSGLQYIGQTVSRGDLQPGDLVFFDTYKHNGHVGIYIGGNQFIGSQDSTGVAVVNMSNSYWASRYSTAKRVLH